VNVSNIFFRKSIFCLPSLVALTFMGAGLPAIAQTVDAVDSATAAPSSNQETPSQNLSTATTTVNSTSGLPQFPNATTQQIASRIVTPVPGTVTTSSVELATETVQPAAQPSPTKVAQSDIDVGRPTRGGQSYVGVAGNIGLSGDDSSLGDGNFAVISKIGLTNAISFRPSAVIGDNTTILIPVTYDFSFKQADAFSEPLAIAPYVGVGAAIKTGDNSQVAFLVSGGIDVPLNSRFTATAAVNAGFFDTTDVGLLVGVGYNFSGF
jgi:hypothetical protein